jgi:hypothetical protein
VVTPAPAPDRPCFWCGEAMQGGGACAPTIEHVIPRFLGGGRGPANKVWACASCNRLKGILLPEEFARSPALERMPRSRRDHIRARCAGIWGARDGYPWPPLPLHETFASRLLHPPLLLCDALPAATLERLRQAGLLQTAEVA